MICGYPIWVVLLIGAGVFCASFVDAIGGIFDWNALFDAFPGDIYVNLYRIALLTFSMGLWICAERRGKDELQQKGGL